MCALRGEQPGHSNVRAVLRHSIDRLQIIFHLSQELHSCQTAFGLVPFPKNRHCLLNEYNASCRWEPVSLYKACWVESDDPAELEAFKKRKYQYMAKDREGRDVFLADSGYVLQMAQMDFKHIKFHFTSEF